MKKQYSFLIIFLRIKCFKRQVIDNVLWCWKTNKNNFNTVNNSNKLANISPKTVSMRDSFLVHDRSVSKKENGEENNNMEIKPGVTNII